MRNPNALSRSVVAFLAAALIAVPASASILSSGQSISRSVAQYSAVTTADSPEIFADVSPIESNLSIRPDSSADSVATLAAYEVEPNLFRGGAPEPASLLLVGAGLIALAGFGARRIRSRSL